MRSVIAVIDTGVDWDHEDLQSNIWQNLAEDADSDGHTMEFDGTQWVLDPGDLNGIDDDLNGFTDDLIGWNFIGTTAILVFAKSYYILMEPIVQEYQTVRQIMEKA